MRDIAKIIIHCAATPADMDIGVAEIRRWHVDERGWRDIGYHFVIRRDGTVERGRPQAEAGAHVRGHNGDSIGICLVGGKPGFNFHYSQMDALVDLVLDLRDQYPSATVHGHNEFDSGKDCPCFDVQAWFDD